MSLHALVDVGSPMTGLFCTLLRAGSSSSSPNASCSKCFISACRALLHEPASPPAAGPSAPTICDATSTSGSFGTCMLVRPCDQRAKRSCTGGPCSSNVEGAQEGLATLPLTASCKLASRDERRHNQGRRLLIRSQLLCDCWITSRQKRREHNARSEHAAKAFR